MRKEEIEVASAGPLCGRHNAEVYGRLLGLSVEFIRDVRASFSDSGRLL